jgi:2',3'-cyclic-nucleotide 2'-phosphodiesterase/3'-nucleotidase
MIALHPFSARAAAGQAHLRVMETTDLHVHVWPYDYYSDRRVDTVGLARTAAHVEAARAEATNSLLVDNGDFLQGNPMGDYIAYERGMRDGDLHPVIQALNAVGIEASTLGNHDFNYGLDFLMKSLAGAKFPIVSANVLTGLGAAPRRDRTLVPPYVILNRMLKDGAGMEHPIRVGLIGFCPPQIVQWDRGHLEGRVVTRDIVASARAWVPQMREEGADLVLALSHSGLGSGIHSEGMENASTVLAAVDGIDAVFTGHSHLVFPGPAFAGFDGVDLANGTVMGKPVVMGGLWGDTLGIIDLLLERDARVWTVVSSSVGTRGIYRRNADRSITANVESVPAIEAAVAQDHAATLAYVRRPVGRTSAPLHSYFALVANDPGVQVVNQAQRWYIAQMLRGSAYEALPLLSAAAPFKAGGRGGPDYYTDVAAGDVAIRNVADLYLYPNTVRAVKVTGAQVKDWLERSAGIFNRIVPGQADQPLVNPDFPSYNFDIIDGVTYEIDLSQPSRFGTKGEPLNPDASRIVALTYKGRPVDPAAEFVVATNNYRASGGGTFPGAVGDTIIFEAPDTNRDVIVRFILETGTLRCSPEPTWRFASMPGTSVLFDTGPDAAAYLGELQSLAIEPAGDGPDGFARYRIGL